MDFLGPLAGLLGAGLQASHQGLADAISWMNLQFQKAQADKQFRLASAGRSDVFGNKQVYNPATNSWDIALTPTQNQITKAGEKEQLLSLTEDAMRNRNIKRAQVKRGREAEPLYNEAIAGYRYNQPKDERSIRDELTALGSSSTEAGLKGQQAMSIRQALRANQGGLLPSIVKTTDDAVGKSLADTLIKARNQAVGEAATRQQQHDQTYLPKLNEFMQIMDAGGGAPQKFSDLPQQFSSMQGQNLEQMLNALRSGTSSVGSAYTDLASNVSKSPDLSKIAGLISGVGNRNRKQQSYNVVNSDSYSGGDNSDYSTNDRLDLMTTGNW